jgi:hypothetical protein
MFPEHVTLPELQETVQSTTQLETLAVEQGFGLILLLVQMDTYQSQTTQVITILPENGHGHYFSELSRQVRVF